MWTWVLGNWAAHRNDLGWEIMVPQKEPRVWVSTLGSRSNPGVPGFGA